MLPFDTQKPSITSGLRLGTAAMTTRGYKEKDFKKVAQKIFDILTETEMKKVGMINEK
jgi:glycine hydroxymethyltransferase